MNPKKKATIRHEAGEEQQLHQREAQASGEYEFGTVEEMLRHDALHTPVPPAIAHRLQESAAQLPPPRRPAWWRRLFGGSSA